MNIEYEATFVDIEIEDARERLKKIGAELIRPEFMQKRLVFDPPKGTPFEKGFVRLRDEGDKITLAFKIFEANEITGQKEVETEVKDFQATQSIIEKTGCTAMSYEESKRELWKIENVDITIDTWPHLGTIVEVEGKSEEEVKVVSEKLGFDWKDAKFCSIGKLYAEKYGLGPVTLAKKTGVMTQLTFSGKNPFI